MKRANMSNAELAKPGVTYVNSAFLLIFEELILQVKQQTVFLLTLIK